MSEFDPYHKWLGIPPAEQPPNLYRLLGVALFEDDRDVIEAAADQRMAFVQMCATGEYLKASQEILNALSRARTCLLDPALRLEYARSLKAAPAASRHFVAASEGVDRPREGDSNTDYQISSLAPNGAATGDIPPNRLSASIQHAFEQHAYRDVVDLIRDIPAAVRSPDATSLLQLCLRRISLKSRVNQELQLPRTRSRMRVIHQMLSQLMSVASQDPDVGELAVRYSETYGSDARELGPSKLQSFAKWLGSRKRRLRQGQDMAAAYEALLPSSRQATPKVRAVRIAAGAVIIAGGLGICSYLANRDDYRELDRPQPASTIAAGRTSPTTQGSVRGRNDDSTRTGLNQPIDDGASQRQTTGNSDSVPIAFEVIDDQVVEEFGMLRTVVRLTSRSAPASGLTLQSDAAQLLQGAQFDPDTGVLQWVPGEDDGGTRKTVRIAAIDSQSNELVAEATFAVRVTEVNNHPPRFAPIEPPLVYGGEVLRFKVQAIDLDRPMCDLQYFLVDPSPTGAQLDRMSGELTWSAPIESAGTTVSFRIRAVEVTPEAKEQEATVQVPVGRPRGRRGVARFDVIWQLAPNSSATNVAYGMTANLATEFIESRAPFGARPTCINAYHDTSGALRFAVVAAESAQRFQYRLDLQQAEYQGLVTDLATRGFIPAWTESYNVGNRSAIAAIWIENTKRWQARSGTLSNVLREAREIIQSGLQIATLSIDDDDRYARALLIQDGGYTTMHYGLTLEEVSERVRNSSAFLQPIWIDAYWKSSPSGDVRLYTLILKQGSNPQEWQINLDLLPHEFGRLLRVRQSQGFVPVILNVR